MSSRDESAFHQLTLSDRSRGIRHEDVHIVDMQRWRHAEDRGYPSLQQDQLGSGPDRCSRKASSLALCGECETRLEDRC